jgi:hypothetical protein
MRHILLFLVIASTALASDAIDKGETIIGKWEVNNPRRTPRIVFFHPNHTWGVTNFDPGKSEEINGRRWRIDGDKLILTFPHRENGRDLLKTQVYKIVSFGRNKFATDVFSYTRLTK